MTQYIEHYKCNGAPCVHVEPPMKQEALDYLIGQMPPRYPLPAIEVDNLLAMPHVNVTFFSKSLLLEYMQAKR